MLLQTLTAFAVALLLLAAAAFSPSSIPVGLYQFLCAAGLCAVAFSAVLNNLQPPGNLPPLLFYLLGTTPFIIQMVISVFAPELFWVAPIMIAAMLAYIFFTRKSRTTQKKTMNFPLTNKAYLYAGYFLAPVAIWDYRQFIAVYFLWVFSLWCLKEI